MTKSKTFTVWQMMLQRCYNSKHKSFPRYGGRGIFVCDTWRNDFSTFLSDMGQPPTIYHTLDRIDNDSGYSKNNCKWSTLKEQGANKSNNVYITYLGVTKHISEWSRELDVVFSTLRRRLEKHPVEVAMTMPPSRRKNIKR